MIPLNNNKPFTLISGPCQLQDEDHCFFMAEKLLSLTNKLDIPFIFKTSFDKANRTSVHSKRGVGLNEALNIFHKLKNKFPQIRILTDVHETHQVNYLDGHVDILQVPAFLCRQTDLIASIVTKGIQVNIKKGQFLSPYAVKDIVEKCRHYGDRSLERVCITERGTTFGYSNLVVDMTGLQIIKQTTNDIPLIIDGTHAVQQPATTNSKSAGNRSFVTNLVQAALTYKLAGVFIECHEDPDNAPSDGPNAVHLKDMPKILQQLKDLDNYVKEVK